MADEHGDEHQSEQDIEDQLFSKFGGGDDEPSDTSADDDDPADADGDDDDAPAGDDEPGVNARKPGDVGDDMAVDFEYEGRQYKIPKPIVEGVMRAEDYTRKTQEVATLQQQVSAAAKAHQIETEMWQALAPYHIQMQNLDSQIAAAPARAPDPAQDPIGYMTFTKQVDELRYARQQLGAQFEQARSELARQKQSATQELLQAGRAVVLRHIPKWDDKIAQDVTQHLRSLGYGPAELESLTDPRTIILAYESMQMRQMKAGMASARNKRADAPPPVVRAKGSGQSGDANNDRYEKARARLKRTGNTRDAENALLAAIERNMQRRRK